MTVQYNAVMHTAIEAAISHAGEIHIIKAAIDNLLSALMQWEFWKIPGGKEVGVGLGLYS